VVTLSVEKKLELEKYVFHASSLGFSKDQIRQALLEKGWPTGAVDDVLLNIMQVK